MSKPAQRSSSPRYRAPLELAVIWIDWYAYHVARFKGLLANAELQGRVAGIELVGGIGVHAGLKFREDLPADLPVETLLPTAGWRDAGQLHLSRLLWAHLTRLDPAAVLVPGYYTLPALTAALWARAHDRVSILMTESTAYDHVRVAWKEAAKSLLLRSLFHAAVAGGKAHLRYLEQLRFPSDRVARFYDVVDNATLAATAAALRQGHRPHLDLPAADFFLYVGRLAPEKNLETLLEAWIAYREAGGVWDLVLVGDGPSAPALRDQVGKSGLAGNVHFAGHRGSADLPVFYAFAGCFVLPSRREPWGLVVNEAMACGLPVLVSTRCGSAEDLLMEGRNGFTFDPQNASQLAQHLTTIANLSAEDRQQFSQESIRAVAPYSPQNFGSEIAHLVFSSRERPLDRSDRTTDLQ